MGIKATVIACLLSAQAFAQPPLNRANFDTTEVYAFQKIAGYYKHTDGGDVALIVVRAESIGALYRVAMRMDQLDAIKEGDPVTVETLPIP